MGFGVLEVAAPEQAAGAGDGQRPPDCAHVPVAVRQAKQAIVAGWQMSLADGLALEIEAHNRTIPTKGQTVKQWPLFNEKRAPNFTGD